MALKTINTTREKCVQFTLTLAKNDNPNSFKVLNEITLNKHPFLTNDKRTLNSFKVANIKELIVSMYANEIQVEMIVKDDNYDRSLVIMKQSCVWNN
jgi:translation initiation factor IF-2